MEGLKIHGIYEARKGGKRAQDLMRITGYESFKQGHLGGVYKHEWLASTWCSELRWEEYEFDEEHLSKLELREVSVEELPLYIGWKYVTKEYRELLNN